MIGLFCALAVAVVCLAAPPARAAAGDLDGTFGTGGKVTTDFAGNGDQANAVALQPDGKIVAAGGALGTTVDFALARYRPDGTLDTTFGSGGKVRTDFGSGEQAFGVAVQPDGKIVAAGGAATEFELARYNADGTLDSTFGVGGKVTTRFGLGLPLTVARAIVLQPDGKIVVAGTLTSAADWDFGLARYNPNGTLDTSFGVGGKVTTDISGHLSTDIAWAVALQLDGKLVVAGSTTGPSGDAFALARYTPSGTLDSTFGSSGRVVTGFGGDQDWAQAVAVQADGKIVAAGKTGNQCCGGTFNFALARYNAGGALDATFGAGGKVTTDFDGSTDNARALVIQADGKILAGGERLPGGNATGVSFDFALARYQPSGSLDATFGTGGKVTTDFPGHNDHVYALALQQDGKVVAAGDSSPDFALARYTVTTANNPPVAGNDSYTTAEDMPSTVAAPGVLANDTDVDGDPMTAALATGPAHGALTLNANGSFTYTPAANFNGTDSFTYNANDGRADSNLATVTISVTEVNDPPTAATDSATLAEDDSVAIDVTANDAAGPADEAGQALSVSSLTEPTHGQAVIVALGSDAGKVRYTPVADYNGSDSFTYTVCDDGTTNDTADPACDTASVAVSVTEVNDAPMAVTDSVTLAEDASTVIDVTGNDAPGPGNEAGQALSVSSLTQPAHGQATIITGGADAGKVNYTPAVDYNGLDSFAYTVCDDGTTNALADPKCDTASVAVTVAAANDAPVARDDSYRTDEDTPLTVPAPAVLANDTDADGDPVSVAAASVTAPAHGTVAVDTDGSLTYTPEANFNGSDTFTYKAGDGTDLSTAATVTITVAPVPDAPTAQSDSYGGKNIKEDTPFTVAAPGVLANDSDAAGDPLTATLVTGPVHGTLTLSPDGAFTYTPEADFNGRDTFTYKASDGALTSDVATVTITVLPMPDPPVAQDDSYSTDQGTPLTVTAPGVLANDSDPDGDRLAAVLMTGPAHGALTLSSNGSFTYTPVTNFKGQDSFTYMASDGGPTGSGATVTITVVPAPGNPVAQDDSYHTDQDTLLTVPAPGVLANDSDTDGDPLVVIFDKSALRPAHGTLTLSSNGAFRYTPTAGFTGQDSFTYTASDGALTSNVATVTITVTPKVLFTSTRDGNPEIYVMKSDGSGVTRLTTNTAADTNPVWSPGRRKIAFTSTRDGNAEIYVMNADGTAQTRLTSNSMIDTTPAWSPDGTRIAFARGGGNKWDIYVMNADGTAQTRLTSNPAIDTTPAWSPDGQKIAFSSTRDGNPEIYIMPATGEGTCQVKTCTIAKRLTTNSAIDTSPTWLGTRIAFASTRDDPNSEIYVMNADGTAQTRLTVNPAIDATPAGSPDGHTIVFSSTRDDPNPEIYAMQADGTAVTRLTTNPASDTFPDW
ncbi:MAG TPA: Ig-like domain-containing protein [Actinomycetes bacterium]